MRILTVRQPWAWAIIHGGKDVENRVRNIAGDYRGPVAIHAGLAEDIEAYRAADRGDQRPLKSALRKGNGWDRIGVPTWRQWRGHIIGIVDLVDVHNADWCWDGPGEQCSPWAESDTEGTGVSHLVFKNPRALDQPVPWKGALGLRRAHNLEVVGEYLCEFVGQCTCHRPVSGPHETGCGLEPLAKLEAVSA